MFHLLVSWPLQLVTGWAIAAGSYRLIKAERPGLRPLGWGLGVLFAAGCVHNLYWDARFLFVGYLPSLVSGGLHGFLLLATTAVLTKAYKEGQAPLPKPSPEVRQLPHKR